MRNIMSFVSGVLFAIGLIISGMTNPKKVIGFLDIFGDWDYSLAFVMGGALIINLIFFKMILKRKKPIYSAEFDIPESKLIDKELIFGAALFGIGWGLIGLCPGPAIVNLVTLSNPILVFVAAMTGSIFVYEKCAR